MDEFFRYYKVEPDAKRVEWIVERRAGPKMTLHAIVPSDFASYVRILHPAWSAQALDRDDEKAWRGLRAGWREAENLVPIRWADTAEANNRDPHRLMQWSDICSSAVREPGAAGVDPPFEGELTPEMVEGLFDTLTQHNEPNQEVLCGFWQGYARFYNSSAQVTFQSYTGDQRYVVFNTTISRLRDGWLWALEHSLNHHGLGTNGLAPSAVWPTTRGWYLATDYNLCSTYVGGPIDLVNSLLMAPRLETYVALPGDKIS